MLTKTFTVVYAFHGFICLELTTTLGACYVAHFTDKGTETYRN